MSDEKIDVLAVLDAEVDRAGGEVYEAGRRLVAARDAVRELIEAARGFPPVSSGWRHATPEDERRYKRLAAALEGCGVAANVPVKPGREATSA